MNKVVHSSVFSWRRNAKYVDDVLTDEGNAFQARAAATGKARSPRVARRVDGTSSVDIDADLRRRRDSIIAPEHHTLVRFLMWENMLNKKTTSFY